MNMTYRIGYWRARGHRPQAREPGRAAAGADRSHLDERTKLGAARYSRGLRERESSDCSRTASGDGFTRTGDRVLR